MGSDLVAMIATHLNAPYGSIVHEDSIRAVLSHGTLNVTGLGELERELLATMFVECPPSLIGRACNQIPTDLENAHRLYLELVAAGGVRVERWESTMKDVVA